MSFVKEIIILLYGSHFLFFDYWQLNMKFLEKEMLKC